MVMVFVVLLVGSSGKISVVGPNRSFVVCLLVILVMTITKERLQAESKVSL